MSIDTTYYDHGTSLTVKRPWSLFVKAKAICPDGKVRSIRLSQCADGYTTVPGRVNYRGITVSGFITFKEGRQTMKGDLAPLTEPVRWIEFHSKRFVGLMADKIGLDTDTPEGIVMDAWKEKGLMKMEV